MKTGRNEPCPCGSGLKYKQCCLNSRGGLSLQMKLLLGLVALIISIGLLMVLLQVIGVTRGSALSDRPWPEVQRHSHYPA